MMIKPLALQPPVPKLLTSRDKYENSYWMEQLPAHIWVQNEENSVIYSNRLPVRQLASAHGGYCRKKKISCCQDFMGEKKTCTCCPYQRLASTLQPESCVCRKGGEIYHVYHYPIMPNGRQHWEQPINVLKMEINVGGVGRRRKRAEKSVNTRGTSVAEKSPAPGLIKICSVCKKIGDESGGWRELENYFSVTRGLQFSHGLCGDCACQLYPEIWSRHS